MCYDKGMTTTTRRKADIDLYYDHGTEYPSVNVKVYESIQSVDLPLVEGLYKNPGDTEWQEARTHDLFTHDWLSNHEQDLGLAFDSAFEWACRDGFEMVEFLAKEMFGDHVHAWSVGRSGGHLIVDGLPDVETWDAIAVSRWHAFARKVEDIRADTMYRTVSGIYHNVFLAWLEEQEAEEGAELPVTLNA